MRVSSGRDAVELDIGGEGHDEEVAGKVARFLEAMLKRSHRFDTKVYWRTLRRDRGPLATGVHAEMRRRGWLFDYGKGHVALAGPVLALARLIDARAEALYRDHFGAMPGSFPSFVDARILHRCGYFDSHPNAVSFVGHVAPDFDAIEAFRRANSCSDGAVVMRRAPAEPIAADGRYEVRVRAKAVRFRN